MAATRSDRLLDACRNADLESVTSLLNEGANVDFIDAGGCAPIHAVVVGHDLERACLDRHDEQQRAAILSLLIARGANVNVFDHDGFTALHLAAVLDKVPLVAALLRAPRLAIDLRANKVSADYTPFALTAYRGSLAAARELLRFNPDLAKTISAGASPLWHACHRGRTSIVVLLCEHLGPDNPALNAPYFNTTPLTIAVQRGSPLAIARVLLAQPAVIGVGDALECAVNLGVGDLVTLLLQTAQAEAGRAPAAEALARPQFAAARQPLAIMEILVAAGADPQSLVCSKPGDPLCTSLTSAAEHGALEMVHYLTTTRGPDGRLLGVANGLPDEELTPLCAASSGGHAPVVEYLVGLPDVSRTRICGESSPIARAACAGSMDCVRILCEFPEVCATLDETSQFWTEHQRTTPYEIAMRGGRPEVAHYIKNAHADHRSAALDALLADDHHAPVAVPLAVVDDCRRLCSATFAATAFGEEALVTTRSGNRFVVAKVHALAHSIKSANADVLAPELAAMLATATVHHPNLTRLVGICDMLDSGVRNLLLLYKPADDSVPLHTLLATLTATERLRVLHEVALGLAAVHAAVLTLPDGTTLLSQHRNLTSRSVLLCGPERRVRLTDCWLLPLLNPNVMANKPSEYIPIEVINHLLPALDVYSFGVLTLELLYGLRAGGRAGEAGTMQGVVINFVDQGHTLSFTLAGAGTAGAWSEAQARQIKVLAAHCLVLTPKDRPTAQQIAVRVAAMVTAAGHAAAGPAAAGPA